MPKAAFLPMDDSQLDQETVLARLGTDRDHGLDPAEALRRLQVHGPNELVETRRRTPLKILWEQLRATMVVILLLAAVAAFFLGDVKDAVAILAIVVLFVLLGFFQDFRAERAIAALRQLAVPRVRVVRGGASQEIPASDLVPGDLVLIETGNLVPADGRLLEAINLRVQEAALTGESEAVEKETGALAGENLPLGDRRNLAYMGTIVSMGRGCFVVTATGMATELGKIADLLQSAAPGQTPLQKRLDRLGTSLAATGAAAAVLIFFLGTLRGEELRLLALTAVSLAVAIIPEGLPAVVTITLALGAQRMLRRNALIRRLPAVEALGSVTVICTDKTGTLTENRMTVVTLALPEQRFELPQGEGESAGAAPEAAALLLLGGALCNDAQLAAEPGAELKTLGDPTEGALIAVAERLGLSRRDLDALFPRSAELPFDAERKRMTTLHPLNAEAVRLLSGLPVGEERFIAFTKGAPDGLLDCSTRIAAGGREEPLDAAWRRRIEEEQAQLAARGMRVLAVACRRFADPPELAESEAELTFIGLFGIIDPPRSEAREAITLTRSAGIRTVMITGDHPLTAAEIGRQLGLDEGRIVTGAELARLSAAELQGSVDAVRIFARVSPQDKIRIVEALQAAGHIAAMTGDGVNDAPALRKADIGVAMGITGTDVAKEAADLVLLDDNFATIVAAVREGRTIYDNILKFVKFSIAGNLGKLLVMLIAPFFGNPLPLLPLQLLWLNLLTDGLLGLGMGVEAPERGIMARPPFSPQEGIFNAAAAWHVLRVGTLIGAIALALCAWYFFNGHAQWQTVVFTYLTFAQIGQALASRSTSDSFFALNPRSNPLLAGMVGVVLLLQLAVVYLPVLQGFFATTPLAGRDLGLILAASLTVFFAIELEKWWLRRRKSFSKVL